MLPTSKILGVFNWCLCFLAISIYVLIFVLAIKAHRSVRDIALLLTYNTCFAAFCTCAASAIMIASNLFTGFLVSNMTFCYVWGLFYDICECSVYFSYCLQGFYRLCRVVFYKKKFLVSHYLYIVLIICQWTLVLILLVPPIFIKWYARLSTEYYCLIPYTYIGPEVYHILVLYLIPLGCLGTVYVWITTNIRNISRTPNLAIEAIQRQRNQRDLVVIKRILFLLSILIVLRFPTVIFMVYGIVVGSLYPLTYAIVGITTSMCLIVIGFITIKTTTELEKQFLSFFTNRNNRVMTGPIPRNIFNRTNAAACIRTTSNG
ncbi:unnamed protein product [Adineta ricciae]|uniref:G-protein coupled receptors family 1 profile domain-containing protein n=1 Tax=Adineta ricciae TaxID=249248 RepID=A0A815NCJ2_ADIRI|nr:unnamed protein product [Adineta ricciae]CAF1487134.1 unnamed protein product [Adineta ricciae]